MLKTYVKKRLAAFIRRTMADHHVFGDPKRLDLASSAVVHDALFNVSSGRITVSEHVFFGHGVRVITGTHDFRQFGPQRLRAIPSEGHDVLIEEGAWIGTNAVIVGPCVIGRHAVVGAGAVVVGDVAPYTITVGVPARPVRTIEHAPDGQID